MSTDPAADYILPTNVQEAERLDFQHNLLTKIFDGLHRAPLDPAGIKHALDLGCGTGNWTVDFARQYSHAEVLGVDISASSAWESAPSNCKFRVANFEQDATWSDFKDHFDFIHGRMLVIAIKDWPLLLKRCFDHLKPGGWIEFQDLRFPIKCEDTSAEEASKLVEWSRFMTKAMEKMGMTPAVMSDVPEVMKGVGFVHVKSESFKMISGPWAGSDRELGHMGQENIRLGLRGFSNTAFTRGLGWTADRHEDFCQEILKEVRECEYRTYLPLNVCLAQKPV